MAATTFDSTAEGGDPVACYATADGAERAVSQLITLGYDERDVALAPRGFDVEDPHPLRRRLGAGMRFGALVGACVAGAVEALRRIGVDVLVSSVLPVVGLAALVGASFGVLLGVIVHRRGREVTFGPDPERLVPHRYVVLVDHEPARARHGLARWWDPAAPPPGRQQPPRAGVRPTTSGVPTTTQGTTVPSATSTTRPSGTAAPADVTG